MTLVEVGDIFVAGTSLYMLSNLMYRINKGSNGSLNHKIINTAALFIPYFILNYCIDQAGQRIIWGIVMMMIYNIVLFDGTILSKALRGLLGYSIFVGLDFLGQIIYAPVFLVSLKNIEIGISSRLLIARNIYNVTFYLFLTVLEYFLRKEERGLLKEVTFLPIILAVCQIVALLNLYLFNPTALIQYLVPMSGVYSGIIILGYFVTMEMFYQVVNQREKQNELEQQLLEKQYQYDYYLLAYEQGEQIRDLRHDIRNQLQAIQYLIGTEEGDGHERAEDMLKEMRNRMVDIKEYHIPHKYRK